MRSESKTFAVSKTVHHTIEPAGQIKHLAAAVLVDDAVDVKEVGGKRQETRRKRTPDEMKQLDDLVRAAVGFDAKRGDELALQNISFQEPPAEIPVVPSAGPARIANHRRHGFGYCGMPAGNSIRFDLFPGAKAS